MSILLAPMLAVTLLAQAPAIVLEQDASGSTSPASVLAPATVRDQQVQPSVRQEQDDIVRQLRMQTAVRTAKESLHQRDYVQAIRALEPALADASTCPEMLAVLESAYRGRISELLAKGSSQEASIVAERLRALSREVLDLSGDTKLPADPTAKPGLAQSLSAQAKAVAKATVGDPVASIGKQMAATVKSMLPTKSETEDAPITKALGKMDEVAGPPKPVDHAGQLFKEKRYAEALVAYEKAYEIDPVGVQKQRVRWGYCLLYVTIQRYNELVDQGSAVDPAVWEGLLADAQTARQLAPTIPYCETVIASIESRQQESKALQRKNAPLPIQERATQAYGNIQPVAAKTLEFRHHPAGDRNWRVAETANFVIYHRDPRLAEEIGPLAEEARRYASQLWFKGESTPDWQPKCHLYLYPTGQEYGTTTGVGPESPGHSSVVNSQGNIQSRQVHLRVDDPTMKFAVLPHEIAHVVLAGRFGVHTLPRWADEGMAVLTEPVDKQDAHLANLSRTQSLGRGYTCGQVMTMGQYPAGERMRDFYAHSVGICRYLVERHGHDRLIAFLRQSLDTGNYEQSLQQVYGMRSFGDLEGEFRQYVATIGQPTQVARGL
jgi:tetratricopeptide (TPR) repeat protein